MFQKIIDKVNDLRPKQLIILAGVAAFLMFATMFAMFMSFSEEKVVEQQEEKPV